LSAILTLEGGIVGVIAQSAVAPSVFSEGGKILIQDSFEVNDRASDSFEVSDRVVRLHEYLGRTSMVNQSHRHGDVAILRQVRHPRVLDLPLPM
jgi:hypothetical protein